MRYQVLENRHGKWYWQIIDASGKILSVSPIFSTKQKAEETAQAVKNQSMYCIYEVVE